MAGGSTASRRAATPADPALSHPPRSAAAATPDGAGELVLTLACPDRRGIVARVAGFVAARDGNILDSHQFGDPDAGTFFMRLHVATDGPVDVHEWRTAFAPIATDLAMRWNLVDLAVRPRVLVLVSREGHCLNDLLYRWSTRALRADVVGVASPYDAFATLVGGYGVPYRRLPGPGTAAHELDGAILGLVEETRADLVVLARFMQILGRAACRALEGRAINIHHSFLPSFKGAGPYRQAHDRGVKLIGATAHYVTDDLDEGPIIEQEVARVDHSHSVAELARVGRDVECVALARAVRWHVEHRVLVHGRRTVVFR